MHEWDENEVKNETNTKKCIQIGIGSAMRKETEK